jgi:hypothetical protein
MGCSGLPWLVLACAFSSSSRLSRGFDGEYDSFRGVLCYHIQDEARRFESGIPRMEHFHMAAVFGRFAAGREALHNDDLMPPRRGSGLDVVGTDRERAIRSDKPAAGSPSFL